MSTSPSLPPVQSPFQTHIGTNYVPLDPEIAQIRAHLVPHEAELARLEALILDLTAQRDRVRDYIGSHKALTSWPRRIPQDVLEEIFLRCMPTRRNAVMSPTEAPLLLGRICSAWRTVAFSLPALWASLHIPVAFALASENRENAMIDWLERSSPLPLKASLVASTSFPYRIGAITDLLERFSPRWSVLRSSDDHGTEFIDLAKDINAPLLEKIEVVLGDEVHDEDEFLSWPLFRGAANSCKVTVVAPTLGFLVPSQPFTWTHLAHLALKCRSTERGSEGERTGGLSLDAAYALLSGCVRLKSIEFQLSDNRRVRPPWDKQSLFLEFLESMIIVESHWASAHEDMIILVETLIMPRLVKFHLPESAMSVDEGNFFPHLATYSPHVSDLRLGILRSSTAAIVETLQLFSHLTKLWLRYVPSPEYFFSSSKPTAEDLLFMLTSDPTLWPTLTEFIMKPMVSCEEAVWREFLHAHLEHHSNLRRFVLILSDDPPAILPDLTAFLDAGLDITIKYVPFFPEVPPTAWDEIYEEPVVE
ncbi:hypothetical protein C8R46DRAFT_1104796 [Mycena filopes]|nr:hypothetical protein C8R46DRAFT_1104796 [Mycena filopes]